MPATVEQILNEIDELLSSGNSMDADFIDNYVHPTLYQMTTGVLDIIIKKERKPTLLQAKLVLDAIKMALYYFDTDANEARASNAVKARRGFHLV